MHHHHHGVPQGGQRKSSTNRSGVHHAQTKSVSSTSGKARAHGGSSVSGHRGSTSNGQNVLIPTKNDSNGSSTSNKLATGSYLQYGLVQEKNHKGGGSGVSGATNSGGTPQYAGGRGGQASKESGGVPPTVTSASNL